VSPLHVVSNRYTATDAANAFYSLKALSEVHYCAVRSLPHSARAQADMSLDTTLAEFRARVLALPKLQASLSVRAPTPRVVGGTRDAPQCRVWCRARLLRGSTPTLRTLRLKDRDVITGE
jgi:hypothetical protein